MRIFLIGMPFSGKSTLGKELASVLSLKFYDLDTLIIEKEGSSITSIFEVKGEDYFRLIEQKALNDLIGKEDNFVLATGGGTPCFFDNLNKMNQYGVTVFLDVPVEQLAERATKSSYADRPLLKAQRPEALAKKFKSLLIDRSPFYTKAKHRTDGGSESLEELIRFCKKNISK